MRITPLPELKEMSEAIPIRLSQEQFDALLSAIKRGFTQNHDQSLQYLPQYTLSKGDAFFKAKGHFNIFNPCNQWVGDMLHQIGLRTGIWTPTSYALRWSLD